MVTIKISMVLYHFTVMVKTPIIGLFINKHHFGTWRWFITN